MAFASHAALAGAEENVPFQEAKKAFIDAGAADMFNTAYGYALFPSIGKGGIGGGQMSEATLGPRFVSYIDTLLWLEQANKQAESAAANKTGARPGRKG